MWSRMWTAVNTLCLLTLSFNLVSSIPHAQDQARNWNQFGNINENENNQGFRNWVNPQNIKSLNTPNIALQNNNQETIRNLNDGGAFNEHAEFLPENNQGFRRMNEPVRFFNEPPRAFNIGPPNGAQFEERNLETVNQRPVQGFMPQANLNGPVEINFNGNQDVNREVPYVPNAQGGNQFNVNNQEIRTFGSQQLDLTNQHRGYLQTQQATNTENQFGSEKYLNPNGNTFSNNPVNFNARNVQPGNNFNYKQLVVPEFAANFANPTFFQNGRQVINQQSRGGFSKINKNPIEAAPSQVTFPERNGQQFYKIQESSPQAFAQEIVNKVIKEENNINTGGNQPAKIIYQNYNTNETPINGNPGKTLPGTSTNNVRQEPSRILYPRETQNQESIGVSQMRQVPERFEKIHDGLMNEFAPNSNLAGSNREQIINSMEGSFLTPGQTITKSVIVSGTTGSKVQGSKSNGVVAQPTIGNNFIIVHADGTVETAKDLDYIKKTVPNYTILSQNEAVMQNPTFQRYYEKNSNKPENLFENKYSTSSNIGPARKSPLPSALDQTKLPTSVQTNPLPGILRDNGNSNLNKQNSFEKNVMQTVAENQQKNGGREIVSNPGAETRRTFLIVHPNGTLERTTDFNYITQTVPNYTLLDKTKTDSLNPRLKAILKENNIEGFNGNESKPPVENQKVTTKSTDIINAPVEKVANEQNNTPSTLPDNVNINNNSQPSKVETTNTNKNISPDGTSKNDKSEFTKALLLNTPTTFVNLTKSSQPESASITSGSGKTPDVTIRNEQPQPVQSKVINTPIPASFVLNPENEPRFTNSETKIISKGNQEENNNTILNQKPQPNQNSVVNTSVTAGTVESITGNNKSEPLTFKTVDGKPLSPNPLMETFVKEDKNNPNGNLIAQKPQSTLVTSSVVPDSKTESKVDKTVSNLNLTLNSKKPQEIKNPNVDTPTISSVTVDSNSGPKSPMETLLKENKRNPNGDIKTEKPEPQSKMVKTLTSTNENPDNKNFKIKTGSFVTDAGNPDYTLRNIRPQKSSEVNTPNVSSVTVDSNSGPLYSRTANETSINENQRNPDSIILENENLRSTDKSNLNNPHGTQTFTEVSDKRKENDQKPVDKDSNESSYESDESEEESNEFDSNSKSSKPNVNYKSNKLNSDKSVDIGNPKLYEAPENDNVRSSYEEFNKDVDKRTLKNQDNLNNSNQKRSITKTTAQEASKLPTDGTVTKGDDSNLERTLNNQQPEPIQGSIVDVPTSKSSSTDSNSEIQPTKETIRKKNEDNSFDSMKDNQQPTQGTEVDTPSSTSITMNSESRAEPTIETKTTDSKSNPDSSNNQQPHDNQQPQDLEKPKKVDSESTSLVNSNSTTGIEKGKNATTTYLIVHPNGTLEHTTDYNYILNTVPKHTLVDKTKVHTLNDHVKSVLKKHNLTHLIKEHKPSENSAKNKNLQPESVVDATTLSSISVDSNDGLQPTKETVTKENESKPDGTLKNQKPQPNQSSTAAKSDVGPQPTKKTITKIDVSNPDGSLKNQEPETNTGSLLNSPTSSPSSSSVTVNYDGNSQPTKETTVEENESNPDGTLQNQQPQPNQSLLIDTPSISSTTANSDGQVQPTKETVTKKNEGNLDGSLKNQEPKSNTDSLPNSPTSSSVTVNLDSDSQPTKETITKENSNTPDITMQTTKGPVVDAPTTKIGSVDSNDGLRTTKENEGNTFSSVKDNQQQPTQGSLSNTPESFSVTVNSDGGSEPTKETITKENERKPDGTLKSQQSEEIQGLVGSTPTPSSVTVNSDGESDPTKEKISKENERKPDGSLKNQRLKPTQGSLSNTRESFSGTVNSDGGSETTKETITKENERKPDGTMKNQQPKPIQGSVGSTATPSSDTVDSDNDSEPTKETITRENERNPEGTLKGQQTKPFQESLGSTPTPSLVVVNSDGRSQPSKETITKENERNPDGSLKNQQPESIQESLGGTPTPSSVTVNSKGDSEPTKETINKEDERNTDGTLKNQQPELIQESVGSTDNPSADSKNFDGAFQPTKKTITKKNERSPDGSLKNQQPEPIQGSVGSTPTSSSNIVISDSRAQSTKETIKKEDLNKFSSTESSSSEESNENLNNKKPKNKDNSNNFNQNRSAMKTQDQTSNQPLFSGSQPRTETKTKGDDSNPGTLKNQQPDPGSEVYAPSSKSGFVNPNYELQPTKESITKTNVYNSFDSFNKNQQQPTQGTIVDAPTLTSVTKKSDSGPQTTIERQTNDNKSNPDGSLKNQQLEPIQGSLSDTPESSSVTVNSDGGSQPTKKTITKENERNPDGTLKNQQPEPIQGSVGSTPTPSSVTVNSDGESDPTKEKISKENERKPDGSLKNQQLKPTQGSLSNTRESFSGTVNSDGGSETTKETITKENERKPDGTMKNQQPKPIQGSVGSTATPSSDTVDSDNDSEPTKETITRENERNPEGTLKGQQTKPFQESLGSTPTPSLVVVNSDGRSQPSKETITKENERNPDGSLKNQQPESIQESLGGTPTPSSVTVNSKGDSEPTKETINKEDERNTDGTLKNQQPELIQESVGSTDNPSADSKNFDGAFQPTKKTITKKNERSPDGSLKNQQPEPIQGSVGSTPTSSSNIVISDSRAQSTKETIKKEDLNKFSSSESSSSEESNENLNNKKPKNKDNSNNFNQNRSAMKTQDQTSNQPLVSGSQPRTETKTKGDDSNPGTLKNQQPDPGSEVYAPSSKSGFVNPNYELQPTKESITKTNVYNSFDSFNKNQQQPTQGTIVDAPTLTSVTKKSDSGPQTTIERQTNDNKSNPDGSLKNQQLEPIQGSLSDTPESSSVTVNSDGGSQPTKKTITKENERNPDGTLKNQQPEPIQGSVGSTPTPSSETVSSDGKSQPTKETITKKNDKNPDGTFKTQQSEPIQGSVGSTPTPSTETVSSDGESQPTKETIIKENEKNPDGNFKTQQSEPIQGSVGSTPIPSSKTVSSDGESQPKKETITNQNERNPDGTFKTQQSEPIQGPVGSTPTPSSVTVNSDGDFEPTKETKSKENGINSNDTLKNQQPELKQGSLLGTPASKSGFVDSNDGIQPTKETITKDNERNPDSTLKNQLPKSIDGGSQPTKETKNKENERKPDGSLKNEKPKAKQISEIDSPISSLVSVNSDGRSQPLKETITKENKKNPDGTLKNQQLKLIQESVGGTPTLSSVTVAFDGGSQSTKETIIKENERNSDGSLKNMKPESQSTLETVTNGNERNPDGTLKNQQPEPSQVSVFNTPTTSSDTLNTDSGSQPAQNIVNDGPTSSSAILNSASKPQTNQSTLFKTPASSTVIKIVKSVDGSRTKAKSKKNESNSDVVGEKQPLIPQSTVNMFDSSSGPANSDGGPQPIMESITNKKVNNPDEVIIEQSQPNQISVNRKPTLSSVTLNPASESKPTESMISTFINTNNRNPDGSVNNKQPQFAQSTIFEKPIVSFTSATYNSGFVPLENEDDTSYENQSVYDESSSEESEELNDNKSPESFFWQYREIHQLKKIPTLSKEYSYSQENLSDETLSPHYIMSVYADKNEGSTNSNEVTINKNGKIRRETSLGELNPTSSEENKYGDAEFSRRFSNEKNSQDTSYTHSYDDNDSNGGEVYVQNSKESTNQKPFFFKNTSFQSNIPNKRINVNSNKNIPMQPSSGTPILYAHIVKNDHQVPSPSSIAENGNNYNDDSEQYSDEYESQESSDTSDNPNNFSNQDHKISDEISDQRPTFSQQETSESGIPNNNNGFTVWSIPTNLRKKTLEESPSGQALIHTETAVNNIQSQSSSKTSRTVPNLSVSNEGSENDEEDSEQYSDEYIPDKQQPPATTYRHSYINSNHYSQVPDEVLSHQPNSQSATTVSRKINDHTPISQIDSHKIDFVNTDLNPEFQENTPSSTVESKRTPIQQIIVTTVPKRINFNTPISQIDNHNIDFNNVDLKPKSQVVVESKITPQQAIAGASVSRRINFETPITEIDKHKIDFTNTGLNQKPQENEPTSIIESKKAPKQEITVTTVPKRINLNTPISQIGQHKIDFNNVNLNPKSQENVATTVVESKMRPIYGRMIPLGYKNGEIDEIPYKKPNAPMFRYHITSKRKFLEPSEKTN